MLKISVIGDRFADEKGRHVILRGINMVHKGTRGNGVIDYIAPWDEGTFKSLSEWGFNVVRLGVIWDAVEPQPGVYDEKYLDWIGNMLDLCEKYHIYAFLDMHQDLFSAVYCDGAPEWATITDGQPHVEGELWSDAYIFSEAVKRAFDNFWHNTSAVDGIGLQDHYVNMWIHIAKRFADHPALIGYDFLNEPFPGTVSTVIFGALMEGLAETMNKVIGTQYNIEEMMAMFSRQEDKFRILEFIENKEIHKAIAKAVEPLVEEFDKGVLDAFYSKTSEAVRTIDKDSIIMRENSYFSNIGIQCKADPIVNSKGVKDPQQAFSPHGYDLVVDTEAMQWASNNRIEVIFEAHRRTQQHMAVPVLVGEWGAHASYPEGLSHIEHILSIFDKYLWSSTYWCYFEEFHKAPVLDVLRRPYPQAVCGEILSFGYDSKYKVFNMEWDEGINKESTVIYLPNRKFNINLVGKYSIKQRGQSALVILEPTGGRRSIKIDICQ